MSAIVPFEFNGSCLRVITGDDGDLWFVAGDACAVLEITNVSNALSRLDDDERNIIRLADGNRGNPNVAIISEAGLYTLIIRSDKPQAKPFRRWIAHEVLPAIRKTGAYVAPTAAPALTAADAREHRLLERERRLSRQLARQGLQDFIKLAGETLTPEARQAVAAKVAQVSTGESLPMLLPENKEADWIQPSKIAEMCNRSPNAVGRMISQLGLRDKPGFSKAITDIAKGHHKPVKSYVYSPEAIEMIIAALADGTTSPGGEA